MVKYILYTLLIFLLFGIESCKPDETPVDIDTETEECYLKILLNLPELKSRQTNTPSTKAMDDVAENMIKLEELNVLVFSDDGGTEKFVYKAPLSGPVEYDSQDGTKAMITVKLVRSKAGEQFRLVFLANYDLSDILPAKGDTKADILEQWVYTVSGKWNADEQNYTPFPMWGESDLMTISIYMPAHTTNMYRALARIDVGLNFSDIISENVEGLDNFKLKEVKVYRTYMKGYAAPLNSNMSSYSQPFIPAGAVRNADDAPINYIIADDGGADSYVREIYIPEADLPSSPSNDNMHALVIGGFYKDSPSVTYYRLDFATEDVNTGDRTYLPVLRNHRYAFNINTVRGPGFVSPEAALQSTGTIENLGYDLISWDETIHKMEVQGKYYFGLDQRYILFSPAQGMTHNIKYQTNLPLSTEVVLEWVKGSSSPFQASNIGSGNIEISTTVRNITNEVLSDTLYVKSGPFSIPVYVEQQYVNFKYALNCETVRVNGTYMDGVTLNSTHFITLTLTAEDATILGESYVIQTEDLEGNHGISFSASGTFTSLTQPVTLMGTGTLNHDGSEGAFVLRIKSNSSSESYCEATINIVESNLNILVLANNDASGFNIANSAWGTNKVLTYPGNFGSDDNSIVKISGYNFIYSATYDFSLSPASDPYKWVTGTGNNGKIADITYIAYAAVFGQNTANLLLEYMKKGGVVVAFIEEYLTVRYLTNALFERTDITTVAAGAAGYVYPFPAHSAFNLSSEDLENVLRQYEGDPILNGPFGDVRDKQWGDDRSVTIVINNLPSDSNAMIYSYLNNISSSSPNMTNRQVNGFKYESDEKNLVWFGDGGFMASSSGAPANLTTSYPFYWDTTTMFPIPHPNYGITAAYRWPVYNSTVFCNTMAWAIKKSQALKSKRESFED